MLERGGTERESKWEIQASAQCKSDSQNKFIRWECWAKNKIIHILFITLLKLTIKCHFCTWINYKYMAIQVLSLANLDRVSTKCF